MAVADLSHIKPMFHFLHVLKTSENYKVFWSFQEVKNITLAYNGLTTSDKFLTHIGPMFYFLPPENFRKPCSFLKFSGVQKWNIGSIWVKPKMFVQI